MHENHKLRILLRDILPVCTWQVILFTQPLVSIINDNCELGEVRQHKSKSQLQVLESVSHLMLWSNKEQMSKVLNKVHLWRSRMLAEALELCVRFAIFWELFTDNRMYSMYVCKKLFNYSYQAKTNKQTSKNTKKVSIQFHLVYPLTAYWN